MHLEPDDTFIQTASYQIYRKANKLRDKIKAIQIASRLAKIPHDPNREEKKKPAMEVFKPPDCLKDMLVKIKKEKKEAKEITTLEVDK